ncbi:MAG: hypothetical protein H6683_09925 [Deltaproteobacteria bacterium]|nr:hypothetical protein [Deltaproteobacteria bacterium]MCB9479989.1 hypothetical protein [Deltaproteobacteria bacterium]
MRRACFKMCFILIVMAAVALMAAYSPATSQLDAAVGAGEQEKADISVAPDGRFVVAWTDETGDGDGYGVLAQVYKGDFSAYPNTFPIDAPAKGHQINGRVAMGADGTIVGVYNGRGTGEFLSGVFARVFDETGSPEGGAFLVNTTTAGVQQEPDVAVAPDGSFVVVWSSADQDGDGYGIYAQRYNKNAKAQGDEFKVNTTTNGDQTRPSVAYAPASGKFVVTWLSFNSGVDPNVKAAVFNADGSTHTAELSVNDAPAQIDSYPKVATGADDSFLIVWLTGDQINGGTDVAGRSYALNGAPKGDVFNANGFDGEDQISPSPIVVSDGLILVWGSAGNGSAAAAPSIGVKKFKSDGGLLGAQESLSAGDAAVITKVDAGMDEDGNLFVAWSFKKSSEGDNDTAARVYGLSTGDDDDDDDDSGDDDDDATDDDDDDDTGDDDTAADDDDDDASSGDDDILPPTGDDDDDGFRTPEDDSDDSGCGI